MKRLITLDAAMAAFIGAIGYGVGYTIPDHYGYNTIICFILCFAVGMIADQIADKIIFNSFVQKNDKRRYFVFGGIIALFIIALIITYVFFNHSLLEDLREEFLYVVIPPVAGFIFSYCVRHYKRIKLSKKYGSGEGGFVIDREAVKQLKTMTGKNRIFKEYSGEDPVAKAASGCYIGEKEKDIVRFLGISYAKAERWKRAAQVKDSDDFIEAYYFGNSEIQPENSHNILTGFDQDEDCLNLNIWISNLTPGANKPVLAYIHGGDGRYGGTANPLYHLENIAKAIPEAVFVSINYRLGVFGVIDFSSSDIQGKDEYKDSTSLTLLDQIEALKWIKKNISAFGGDPDNITVAGDSCGGSDICLLSVMDEAKGLFNRALILCASSYDTPVNNRLAADLGDKLIEEFNIQSVSDLKNLSSKQLEDFSVKYYDLVELPPKNGRFVPENVEKKYLSGAASDIEFVFGIAADDYSAWTAMLAGEVSMDAMVENGIELLRSEISKEKRDMINALVDKYRQSDLDDLAAKQALLADFYTKATLLHDCAALAKGGSSVRAFYWDVKGTVEKFTANTVSMVTALLGNIDIAEQMGYLHDKHITEILQAMVKKYMNGETPKLYNNEINGVAEITWHEYDRDKESVLHIQNNEIKMELHPFPSNVKEIESLVLEA